MWTGLHCFQDIVNLTTKQRRQKWLKGRYYLLLDSLIVNKLGERSWVKLEIYFVNQTETEIGERAIPA